MASAMMLRNSDTNCTVIVTEAVGQQGTHDSRRHITQLAGYVGHHDAGSALTQYLLDLRRADVVASRRYIGDDGDAV